MHGKQTCIMPREKIPLLQAVHTDRYEVSELAYLLWVPALGRSTIALLGALHQMEYAQQQLK